MAGAHRGKRPRTGVQPTPEQVLSRVEAHLRSPLTDWDSIYFRIRTSALGDDFPRERFLRTPISTIRWVLRQLDDRDKAQANLQSISVSRLAHVVVQVANGLSGSSQRGPKSSPKDFLPFPDWRPSTAEADGPDQPTKFILSELLRNREIPMHVFVGLITPAQKQP